MKYAKLDVIAKFARVQFDKSKVKLKGLANFDSSMPSFV